LVERTRGGCREGLTAGGSPARCVGRFVAEALRESTNIAPGDVRRELWSVIGPLVKASVFFEPILVHHRVGRYSMEISREGRRLSDVVPPRAMYAENRTDFRQYGPPDRGHREP
jgi:hypothetical protein